MYRLKKKNVLKVRNVVSSEPDNIPNDLHIFHHIISHKNLLINVTTDMF